MTLAVYIGIGLVGGLGALARFGLDAFVSERAGRSFPLGTLVVNLSGALALGILAGVKLGGDGYALLGTGLLGAYTTFSTWVFESHRLAEDGEMSLSAVNFALSLAAGIGAAALGRVIGGAL
jgi:CrcB protein